MTSEQRKATLWGFLFPLLTLGGIVGVLGLAGRGSAPATQAAGTQAAGTQAAGTQAAAAPTAGNQGNSTMSGTGASTTPSTTAGTTTGAPPTPAPSASGTAAPSGGAQAAALQGAAAQGTAAQGTATQGSTTQAPVTGTTTMGATTQMPATSSAGSPAETAANGTPATGARATASAPQGMPVQASANGAQVYTVNCASCHGEQGAGVAGAFPAMAGNKAVLGDDKYLANVLLYGLQGQINVNGQVYNGVMPAWAATLSDAEIAAVITHIRTSWGNTAPAVAEATVKAERDTPKTAVQVLAQRPQ